MELRCGDSENFDLQQSLTCRKFSPTTTGTPISEYICTKPAQIRPIHICHPPIFLLVFRILRRQAQLSAGRKSFSVAEIFNYIAPTEERVHPFRSLSLSRSCTHTDQTEQPTLSRVPFSDPAQRSTVKNIIARFSGQLRLHLHLRNPNHSVHIYKAQHP